MVSLIWRGGFVAPLVSPERYLMVATQKKQESTYKDKTDKVDRTPLEKKQLWYKLDDV